ncbi:MAG: DUF2169 domain-containing protein [Byssovorax sp.]
MANVVWRPGHGGFAFTVVCKATFDLQPDLSPLAALQEPVVATDWYCGEAGVLAFASELVPAKMRPEVLLTGHAYAPEGQSVSSISARLVVGEIDKTIQIVGDRYFQRDGKLSDPESFQRMPLGWERASVGPEGSNPAGRQLDSSAQPDLLGRVPAPNLLPFGLRLASRGDVVPAVGFGPIAPRWPSRAAYLRRHATGWDPSRWHEQPLPADIDLGYFNAAPPDQQRSLPFGEEAIYLESLHPRFGKLPTRLAPVMLAATVDHGAGPQALSLRCDTLIIDTDRGIAMLVWRAHVLLDSPDRPGSVVVTAPGAPQAPSPERVADVFDATATLLPGAFQRSVSVLPFSATAAVARAQAAPARFEVVSPPVDDEGVIGTTMGPGFVIPAAVLPFLAAQREIAARRAAPLVEIASDLPFVRPLTNQEAAEEGPATPRRLDGPAPAASWGSSFPDMQLSPALVSSWGAPRESEMMRRAPELAQPLPSAGEIPAPPPMVGPIAVVSAEIKAKPDSDAPVLVKPKTETGIEIEVEVDFDVYPPTRCGGVAARLACAVDDADKVGEILRAEQLDVARWQRVHEYWLDRIRQEAARSRKMLLSEYDGAYVSVLEAERGMISIEVYARLAEAAERGEVAGALTKIGLPEGAWPHTHRMWIGRMVKDVRLGKQVREAIEARRAAG